MVNSKALSVQLNQELFDNYLHLDFTCEEYLAAAEREDNDYIQMLEQVETKLFSLTDKQYDEILESQVEVPEQ